MTRARLKELSMSEFTEQQLALVELISDRSAQKVAREFAQEALVAREKLREELKSKIDQKVLTHIRECPLNDRFKSSKLILSGMALAYGSVGGLFMFLVLKGPVIFKSLIAMFEGKP